MALDLGLTTRQLLSTMDGVAATIRDHDDRLAHTLERARSVPADEAALTTSPDCRRPIAVAKVASQSEGAATVPANHQIAS